ncbi:hypothetical protein CDAR_289731 [Caerostris darwini]|uniref:Uncharacterized protein n=1 Tax=Caerostris darwini TaxID=1538125 RepID=A0AAV4WZ78_9ARAC|nr:hypothetical protein CDAR_289731 [Caerostris darwini]
MSCRDFVKKQYSLLCEAKVLLSREEGHQTFCLVKRDGGFRWVMLLLWKCGRSNLSAVFVWGQQEWRRGKREFNAGLIGDPAAKEMDHAE